MSSDAEALRAAANQRSQNIRLETNVYANEQQIAEILQSDWPAQTRERIAALNQRGQELLAAVETGMRCNLTTTLDFSHLQRACGLEMTVEDLFSPDAKPDITNVLALKRTLQDLKNHHNKARIAQFSGVIESSLNKLAKVEDELRRSKIDATDLAHVPNAVLKNLQDCMNVQEVQTALIANEEKIQEQYKLIAECKKLRKEAIEWGDMQVTEEQYVFQIELLGETLKLISDKFQIIGTTEEETRQFAKISDVQRSAMAETAAMREHQRRLMQRCNADLRALEKAVDKADQEDLDAAREYAQLRKESDERLRANLERQDSAWNTIQAAQAELQNLANVHYEEVRKRVRDVEREADRQTKFEQFRALTMQHKKLLDLTKYNCELHLTTIKLIEDLVADGCTAIKQRYDATNQELAALRLKVHQEYYAAFERYYRTLSKLAYKKEKALQEVDAQKRTAYSQLMLCVDTYDPAAKKYAELRKQLHKKSEELSAIVAKLHKKMKAALEEFAPTEEALRAAGYDFKHPLDIAEERQLQRRSMMVEYRAQLAKQEDLRLATERAELDLMSTLLQQEKEATVTARYQITAGADSSMAAPAATARLGATDPPATPGHP